MGGQMTPTKDEILNAREHLRMLLRVTDRGYPYGTENVKQLTISIDALSNIIDGTLIEAATESEKGSRRPSTSMD